MAFTHVILTRDYDLATGVAPTGVVSFTPSDWLLNSGVTVVGATVEAPLDIDGKITITVAANTDSGTTPLESSYTVQEDILGQPRRIYRVRVPAGGSVDLSTLPILS